MKKAMRFEPEDNVAVALEALEAGDPVYLDGKIAATARESVPQGHKLALSAIPAGGEVRKYGHVIGTASREILPGEHVHVHNVLDPIADWRGSAHPAWSASAVREISDGFRLAPPPKLTGYRRRDGSVGFRNYLLVLSTCVCGNQPVEDLKLRLRDRPEVVCVTNPSGCVILPDDRAMQEAMLLGLARNPNVGAVIFVGLGCEAVSAEKLCGQIRGEKDAACFLSQDYASCGEAADALERKALELCAVLERQQREEASAADIRLGVQCGASDWTAAAANAAIGYCSDLVVKNGGISILGETCGWFGGEGVLVKQARTQAVADGILALMERVYDRCLFYGQKIEEANPTPGNIAGGITTLCEKALGNTRKGGTAPVEGVLAIGAQPEAPGFYVSDNPGLDAASVFAQTMSSCNVIVYSTGRGSPVGTPVAPVIKLTASPTAAGRFGAHMDVVLTDLILEGKPISDGGRRLFEKVLAVCGGAPSVAEVHGHREYAFPLMMGPM